MSIYVDVSAAVHAKAGLGRYASSLAHALVARWPDRVRLFYNVTGDRTPPAGLAGVPARTIHAGYKPWRMAVWLGQLARAGFNRLVPDASLFHATEHLLMPLRDVPTVLTVHDMIFKLFPEHQKRLNYWYLNATMPLYCRRASAVVTVTEASKRDIVAHYRLPPEKVGVIYEAASPEFRPAPAQAAEVARRRYGLPDDYLIHVGTIEPRKNLSRLVLALDRLAREGLRVPLVVVGARGWLYDDFFRQLETLDVRDDVYFPGHVPGPDLPLLYNAARASVTPSVYEGFGLPVLEAMACGIPVVASHTSSLPEIGGDAALYFDPYDVDAIAAAVRQVWSDPDLRTALCARGLAQAARFSWDRAAQETMALYENVMRGQ
ncbi:MAG: glycosyltransferase family 4 protein [Anaerolineae bacterium]|nr:glycosyltransferase family 4 protein [Anaerolineae bacterium]